MIRRQIRRISRWSEASAHPAFDPSSIPGLAMWMDASVGVSIASGSTLASWTDSVSGAVFAQSNAPPTRNLSGLSGQATIDFSTNQGLFVANQSLADLLDAPTATTVIALCKISDLVTAQHIFAACASGSAHRRACGVNSSEIIQVDRFTSSGSPIAGSSGPGTTLFGTLIWRFTSATTTFRVNGASAGSGTTGSSPTCNQVAIGCRNNNGSSSGFMSGSIAQLMMYNSSLSDADCARIESYLRNRYPAIP